MAAVTYPVSDGLVSHLPIRSMVVVNANDKIAVREITIVFMLAVL